MLFKYSFLQFSALTLSKVSYLDHRIFHLWSGQFLLRYLKYLETKEGGFVEWWLACPLLDGALLLLETPPLPPTVAGLTQAPPLLAAAARRLHPRRSAASDQAAHGSSG